MPNGGGGAALTLFWLPLGAGGQFVRFNGRVYEFVLARAQRRQRCDLYHAALVADLAEGRTTVEMGPEWDRVSDSAAHGAVVSGPVGLRVLGHLRWFRYEVRCWPGGVIPDLEFAVGAPHLLTDDEAAVRRALDAVPQVPPLTWGRDELRLGEMWNSNSVVAWVLVRAGLEVSGTNPPPGGRAPGFAAGIAAAQR